MNEIELKDKMERALQELEKGNKPVAIEMLKQLLNPFFSCSFDCINKSLASLINFVEMLKQLLIKTFPEDKEIL